MPEDVPNIIPAEHLPEVPKEEECILFFSMGRSSFDGGVFHKTLENHKIKPKVVYLIYEQQWNEFDGTDYHRQHSYDIQIQKYKIFDFARTDKFPAEIYSLPVKNANLDVIHERLSTKFEHHIKESKVKNKLVRFSINATAGSSEMIISLFMVGIFYRADIHLTPDTDIVLPIPPVNINLAGLSDCQKKTLLYLSESNTGNWIDRSQIAKHLVEEKCKKHEGSYIKNETDISRIIRPLLKEYEHNRKTRRGYGFIDEQKDPNDWRKFQYCINDTGRYATMLLSLENNDSSGNS